MPTPRAITGKVATFTPIPSHTISASQRMEVNISGMTAHRVARQERKVTRHSSMTAPYTQNSISRLA
ncbi:hypothetical protein D3C86_2177920 [compost metagenome]